MAANLPAIPDEEKSLDAKYDPAIERLTQRVTELLRRPTVNGDITLTTRDLAHETDSEAKRFAVQFNEATKLTRGILFQLHRRFTAYCGAKTERLDAVRKAASGIVARYDQQERRKAEAARLAAARAEHERVAKAKQAEIDARLAEAASYEDTNPQLAKAILGEAQDIEEAPLLPVHVPEVEPSKAENSSVSYHFEGTVTDLDAHLLWLVGISVESLTELLLNASRAAENYTPTHAQIDARSFLSHLRVDVHRELYGEPSKAAMKALLRRMCTKGPGNTILNCPLGISVQEWATSTNRSK